jgi:3-hydroxyacyl-[acyl-carrier-protein] dehydratase
MKFALIDAVLEQSEDRIVAIKQVTLAEEYLGDHFPGFPVLPGVLMVEAMAQAARILLGPRGDGRLVLGEVKALKFGNMVRPGERLRVEVTVAAANDDGSFACRGTGTVLRDGGAEETAVSGRFTMRPLCRTAALDASNRP